MKITDEVVCISQRLAKPGKENELLQALLSLLPLTRQKKGCLHFETLQSSENPRIIINIEKWQNKEIFNLHAEMPYIKNFYQNIAPQYVETHTAILYHTFKNEDEL